MSVAIRQDCITSAKTLAFTGITHELEGELVRLQNECLDDMRRSAIRMNPNYLVIDVKIVPTIYTFVPNTLYIVVSGTMIVRFGS